MYCWGNLISYLPASLKYWSGSGEGAPDATFVLPLILVSQMTGMPFGPVLEKQLGPRLTAVLGGLMMGAGVILASYCTGLVPFTMLYSVLFGLGVGIAYQMPFITGGRWFPAKKGMVTGLIISGMGASAFLFNMLASALINPDGVNSVGGAFPAEVYARWPGLLQKLGLIYGCLAIGGGLLQFNPSSFTGSYPLLDKLTGKKVEVSTASAKAAAPAGPSLASQVFSKRFGRYWLMTINSVVSGLSIAGTYKVFGSKQPNLNSDKFLTMVGSLAAIFGNAGGRFFWASISDTLGFKKPFFALTLLQATTMLNYKRFASSRPAFLLATIVMLFCMGGNFAMMPAQTMREWGAMGPSVYSIMFTAFGTAALAGPIVMSWLSEKGGFELVYLVLGSLSFISTALAATL